MRSQIAVVSIPHTGTVFTCELLKEFKPHAWHLTPEGILDALNFEGKMVIPLRQPEHVMWTWEKRSRRKKEQFHWNEMWLCLPLLAREKDVHFFFLDEPVIHEHELIKLSEFVGTELSTDWTPKNTEGAAGAFEWDGGLSQRVYEWLLHKT